MSFIAHQKVVNELFVYINHFQEQLVEIESVFMVTFIQSMQNLDFIWVDAKSLCKVRRTLVKDSQVTQSADALTARTSYKRFSQ